MPRNVTGVYSLPASNPVVTGTVIESDGWANPTLADIAAALTDSLSRTGSGGMLAEFKIADGIVTAPGLSFLSQSSTGMWKPGDGVLALTVAGINALQIDASTISLLRPDTIVSGLLATGNVTFNQDLFVGSNLTVQGTMTVGGVPVVPGSYVLKAGDTMTGPLSITGFLPYSFMSQFGAVTNLTGAQLGAQNTTPFVPNGAANEQLTGAVIAPQGQGAAAGAAQFVLTGLQVSPVYLSAPASARFAYTGINGSAFRASATDLAAHASNFMSGVAGSAGHGTTLNAAAVTSNIAGVSGSGQAQGGIIGTMAGVTSGVFVGTSPGAVTTVTEATGFLLSSQLFGVGAGAVANITNVYQMRLAPPTLGAGATITNRFGISQEDALGKNVFAGNVNVAGSQPATYINFAGSPGTIASNGLLVQNPTPYVGGGAVSESMIGGIFAPIMSGALAGGATTTVIGVNIEPAIAASAAGSRLTMIGEFVRAFRSNANDLSSHASNAVIGIQCVAGTGTLPAGTATAQIFGIQGIAGASAGATNLATGIDAQVSAFPPAGQSVTITDFAAFTARGTIGGTAGGTTNITNLYGLRLQAVGTGPGVANITNRYGISQEDAAATNNFAGLTNYQGIEVGWKNIPRVDQAGGSAAVGIRGCAQALTSAADYTVPSGVFAAGHCFSIVNLAATPTNILQGAGLTMRFGALTGNRVLGGYGIATVWFASASECWITGSGVT